MYKIWINSILKQIDKKIGFWWEILKLACYPIERRERRWCGLHREWSYRVWCLVGDSWATVDGSFCRSVWGRLLKEERSSCLENRFEIGDKKWEWCLLRETMVLSSLWFCHNMELYPFIRIQFSHAIFLNWNTVSHTEQYMLSVVLCSVLFCLLCCVVCSELVLRCCIYKMVWCLRVTFFEKLDFLYLKKKKFFIYFILFEFNYRLVYFGLQINFLQHDQ